MMMMMECAFDGMKILAQIQVGWRKDLCEIFWRFGGNYGTKTLHAITESS